MSWSSTQAAHTGILNVMLVGCSTDRHPCKSLSRENTRLLTRARRSAQESFQQNPQLARVPLGSGSCLRRTRHPFAVSGPEGRHRRLSLCSLPVPKQFEGSLGSLRSVAQSVNVRDLAGCAPSNPVLFLSQWPVLRRVAAAIFCRHEIAVVRDQRRADKPPACGLPPASLDWRCLSVFPFIEQRQLVVCSRRQLRGLDQTCCICLLRCLESGVRIDRVGGTLFRHRTARSS